MSSPAVRLVLGAALILTVAVAAQFAPGALSRMDTFRVRSHDFVGLRYLTGTAVLRTAGIGSDANIWDDPTPWEERLEQHPLVLHAEIRRRFPATLVVTVEERTPVGLVPRPTLDPVDRDGRFLPLDPSRFPLDYPVLRPGTVGEDQELSDVQIRELAAAADVMRGEPDFWSQVSEVSVGLHDDLVVRWGRPHVVFRLPRPAEARRIREGMAAMEYARSRREGAYPLSVDLRFDDRVFLDWGDAP